MSGKKRAAGSTDQWEMDLPVEGAGSKGTDGGKRKRGRRRSSGGVGTAAQSGEMRAMLHEFADVIGGKITDAREGMEDAIRCHVQEGTAASGGAMKGIMESVEKLARDWKEALSEAWDEEEKGGEEGEDGKSGKKTKTVSRAAALKKVIDEFAGRVRTLHEDVGRARKAQRKSVVVAAVVCTLLAAPVLLGIGLVAQHQLALLPEPEPVVEVDKDAEWVTYVWKRYGAQIIECEKQAVASGREVACDLRMVP